MTAYWFSMLIAPLWAFGGIWLAATVYGYEPHWSTSLDLTAGAWIALTGVRRYLA